MDFPEYLSQLSPTPIQPSISTYWVKRSYLSALPPCKKKSPSLRFGGKVFHSATVAGDSVIPVAWHTGTTSLSAQIPDPPDLACVFSKACSSSPGDPGSRLLPGRRRNHPGPLRRPFHIQWRRRYPSCHSCCCRPLRFHRRTSRTQLLPLGR